MWGIKLLFVALAILYGVFWRQEHRNDPSQLSARGRASRRLCLIFAAVAVFLAIVLRG